MMMNGEKKSSYDYRLLVEEDLREEFSDYVTDHEAPSSTSSVRSLRFPWHVFRIPFRHAIRIVLALPFGAFAFAVVYSICTDYDRAVNVLCTNDGNRKVRNYLPSLSAAIGDFPVSQAVWTLSIVVHAPPRFLFGSMYRSYFETSVPSDHYKWIFVAWIFSVLEVGGLVGLSIITSRHNLPIHATCFATFLTSSEFYMVFQCYLQSAIKHGHGPTSKESKSLRIKKILTKLVLACTAILVYIYFRHEAYCEQGVYTIFAAVEYIIILANMGFHGCAFWDFYDRVIVIDLCRPFVSTSKNSLAWDF